MEGGGGELLALGQAPGSDPPEPSGRLEELASAWSAGAAIRAKPMDQIWLFRLILLAVRDTGSWARPKMPNLDQDAL